MKNDLDSKLLLRVFEKTRQHGEHKDQFYVLDGIKAYTDFDGYTVYMEDALVKLTFGFHNQYHFDYQSQSDFTAFEKKLKNIDEKY